MGHVGMEKKNPFVMTIGFDKNDPEHVEVAEFLNSLPRKKAQYIVEAIKCYQRAQKNRENFPQAIMEKPIDQKAIRQIVMQILNEQKQTGNKIMVEEREVTRDIQRTKESNGSGKLGTTIIEGNEFDEIFQSLQSLRI